MKRHFARSLLALVVAGVGACGGSNGNAPADMTPPVPTDFQGAVGHLCTPMDSRTDNWVMPIAKMSANGSFNVSLMSSTQSPPLIGDLTSWTVQVADAHGAMVDGATIAVKPWMPDHGHGTSAQAEVMPSGTIGQYVIDPLYLFMAGYWTVTLTITSGAVTDTVVFSLCLADF